MNSNSTSAGPMTITELTLGIKSNLEQNFAAVWVAGEVSEVRKPSAKITYFKLKDAGAILPAKIFQTDLDRLKFDLRVGLKVIAWGRLDLWPPQGQYQMHAHRLEPQGIGARELAFRQMKEKLLGKGYFERSRKKPLPRFPSRVALVTSESGAAVRDMLQVLSTRWPLGHIVVCPVRVQGDGAAPEIAAAIRLLNRLHRDGTLCSDVIIVGRGGGGVEDLWAFNEEIVADAIFASIIPIVSAVGHEIDVTISDHVADVHALTPTDAANKVVPSRVEFEQDLRRLGKRLHSTLESRLALASHKLKSLASHGAIRRPLSRIHDRSRRLDQLWERLQRAVRQKVAGADGRIAALAGRLETLSPLNVLQRGYSLTQTADNAILVRDATSLQPGDRLVTRLARGSVVSRVEETIVEPGLS